MDDFDFLSREEILGGLPAKRASTLLFAIENRTAHLVTQSRHAMDLFLTDEAAGEENLAFLEALAQGREPFHLTIQNLERYAPQWESLLPAETNPRVQAAVAHLLSQKYNFTYQAVPGIRAALELDEEAVQDAYQSLYREPLETMFVTQITPTERLGWVSARMSWWLESLPPFWTAFALTLTEIVGAGILALPIAVANIGPLAGIVLLVVLGLVNIVTIAAIAESVSRSGTIRYRSAFIGRVVTDYLGSAGSLIVTFVLIVRGLVVLLAYYIGVATQLEEATRLPAAVWGGLMFLVGLYFLRRKSLNATVASALLVGAINIGLILILSLLAFTHLQLANLSYINVPMLNGRPFQASILQLAFGVVLGAYFGHLSTSNCARVVLRRDSSARSLIWGSIAAQATAMILYCTWVLAVNGAIAHQDLTGETGTVLVPLAAQLGPGVHVLGFILVILALGMGSIHVSLGLFNLVRERLPARSQSVVILPRQQGQLLFRQRGTATNKVYISLSYLGRATVLEPEPAGTQAQFLLEIQSVDHIHQQEITVNERWDAASLIDQLSELRQRGVGLTLEVLDADPEQVQLRVTSPMSLTYEGELTTLGAGLQSPTSTDLTSQRETLTVGKWVKEALLVGEGGRFFLLISPVILVFLLAEWLLLTGTGSFAAPLSFSGVIAASTFAGIFPVLLLVSSRRKGELVPQVVYRFIGHPLLMAGLYLFFLANFFFHGLVIWQSPVQRAGALVVGVLVLGVTIAIMRRGGFARRLVVELRENPHRGGQSIFAVTAGGRPIPAVIQLEYPDNQQQLEASTGTISTFPSLRKAVFHLPANQARELKVWVHTLMSDGDSQGLPALVEVQCGSEAARFDLKLTGGEVVMPLNGQACHMEITLAERE